MFNNFYFNKKYYNPYYFHPIGIRKVVDTGAYISSNDKHKLKHYEKLINITAAITLLSNSRVGLHSNSALNASMYLVSDSFKVDPHKERRLENNKHIIKLIISDLI